MFMADDPGQYCFRHVHDFASFASADRTVTYQVGVEVAATGALDGLRDDSFRRSAGLYFAHFQRPQHAAQSSDAAAVAASLADGFANQLRRSGVLLPVGENLSACVRISSRPT